MNATPHNMSDRTSAELWELASRYCNDMLDAADVARLETLLAEDAGARSFFGVYASMHAELTWRFRGGAIGEAAGGDAAEPAVAPAVVIYPHRAASESPFVESLAFSYMVASVFMCFLLLGFWAYKLPSDSGSSIASSENSRGLTGPGESSRDRPAPVFVGRVTGIAGAKWSDEPNYIAPMGVGVALGRTYKLKTGLMEITYLSGAKVILEGPCSYEVDSTAGGYLALGKLVARVGAGGEGRGAGGEGTAIPESPNPRPSSPQPPIPNPLFAVRTPTAIVTDLGTEFGVEVAANGDTTSQVFQGSIQVRAENPKSQIPNPKSEITLVAGQSARVAKDAETGDTQIVTSGEAGAAPKFVRRIVGPPVVIDLLDIVAGGDGRGARRERGIDPLTGFEAAKFASRYLEGDGSYHPVAWNKLVDGVFIPDGRAGKVQLDSAGHAFDNFPPTEGKAWSDIWARSAEIKVSQIHSSNPDGCWMYSAGRGDQQSFMPGRRGLLGLHANAGISFDLEAISRAHPGASVKGFRAVAGMLDAALEAPWANARADVWIFIDGRLVWQRRGLRPSDGGRAVNVPLQPQDRFLTLVSADGGDGIGRDWVVFGDPVLEATSSAFNDAKGGAIEKP